MIIISLLIGYGLMKLSYLSNGEVSQITHSEWFAAFFRNGDVSLRQMTLDLITRIPFGVFNTTEYFNILWIIPYEIGGYILIYLLVRFQKIFNSKEQFIILIIAILFMLNSYWLSFLFGYVIFKFKKYIRISNVSIGISAIYIILIGSSTIDVETMQNINQYLSTLRSIGAMLIVILSIKWQYFRRILTTLSLEKVGMNSYFYYIFHMIVMVSLVAAIFKFFYMNLKFTMNLSVIISFVSYIGSLYFILPYLFLRIKTWFFS